jgi:hypothetical protein
MPRLLLVLAGLALVLVLAWVLGSQRRPGVAPHASATAPDEVRAAPSTSLRDPDAADPTSATLLRSEVALDVALLQGAPSPLTIAVLDAVDGRHLSDIALRRRNARDQPRGSISMGSSPGAFGPGERDEPLREGLASPFELEADADLPAALWITAPGRVPFAFLRPERPLRGELVVRLEREAGIEVRLTGDVPAPQDAFVHLYGGSSWTAEANGKAVSERPALSPLRFGGLRSGWWCVALEQPLEGEKNAALLAFQRVELAHGEWTTVVLDARSTEDALRPALLTLHFPDTWLREPEALARLTPRAGNARRFARPQALGAPDGSTWGPLGLVPGEYELALEPGHVLLPVELAPGEQRDLFVPQLEFQDVTIHVLEADRTPAELESVAWRTLLDWDGGPSQKLQPSSERVEPDNPIRLRMPAALLELALFRRVVEIRRVTVDLRAAREVEVVLPPHTRLEIDLSAFEDNPDLDWFTRVRLRTPQGALEIQGVTVSSSQEVLLGRIGVDFAGEVDVEFPPLPGHGSLRPRHVTLIEGSTTHVRLDASDLENARLERR